MRLLEGAARMAFWQLQRPLLQQICAILRPKIAMPAGCDLVALLTGMLVAILGVDQDEAVSSSQQQPSAARSSPQ